MQRVYDTNNIKNSYNIYNCALNNSDKKMLYDNPHCIEFFCTIGNVVDCKKCYNTLKDKIKLMNEKDYKKDLDAQQMNKLDEEYCKNKCTDGYFYNFITDRNETDDSNLSKHIIDKYKNKATFKYNKKLYKYIDIPYKLNYELTFPKPKTTVHWGQLKMFLVLLAFFLKTIKQSDKEVHVIYAGSATGDNILLLCKFFPNTFWYLTDPRDHNKLLYNHKQIKEINKQYFDDILANKYYEKFKDRNKSVKLLFTSDIREGTDDDKVLLDQELNINWHKIIQPNYSYLKFRCGYETNNLYDYYKGKIYVQCYAPHGSTETRILLKTKLKPYTYNIEEFQGKLLYFNKIIRPAFHKSIIKSNKLFDNCYDCVYFGYLIKKYINKFPDFHNNNDIFSIMKEIVNFLSKFSSNKIQITNNYIRNNIL